MKKLIVCLTLAAFATISLSAGENCSDKTACTEKAQAACCASQTKTACSSKTPMASRKAPVVKGAQLLARR